MRDRLYKIPQKCIVEDCIREADGCKGMCQTCYRKSLEINFLHPKI